MTKRRHRKATAAKYRKSRKHTRKGVARKRRTRSQVKSLPSPILIPPSPVFQNPGEMHIDELNDGVPIEETQESTASRSTPQKKQNNADMGKWIRRLDGDKEDDTVDNASN